MNSLLLSLYFLLQAPSQPLPSGGQSNWANWNSPNGSLSPFMPTQVIKRVSSKPGKKAQQLQQKPTPQIHQHQQQLLDPNQSSSEVSVNKAELVLDSEDDAGEIPVAMLVNLDASPGSDRKSAGKKKSSSTAAQARQDKAGEVSDHSALPTHLPSAPSYINKNKRGRRLACNFGK